MTLGRTIALLGALGAGLVAAFAACSDGAASSPPPEPAADGASGDAPAAESGTLTEAGGDTSTTDASSAKDTGGDARTGCLPPPTALHTNGCPAKSIFPKAPCNDACLVCDPKTPNGDPGPSIPPPGCVCTGSAWTCPVDVGCDGGATSWFPVSPPAACF